MIHVCENETLRYCKYNSINRKKNIIRRFVFVKIKLFVFVNIIFTKTNSFI